MNLNTPRVDDARPLTEADLSDRPSWPLPELRLVHPMAAEAATDVDSDPMEPPPRDAMTAADLIALVVLAGAAAGIVVTSARGLWQLFLAGLALVA